MAVLGVAVVNFKLPRKCPLGGVKRAWNLRVLNLDVIVVSVDEGMLRLGSLQVDSTSDISASPNRRTWRCVA